MMRTYAVLCLVSGLCGAAVALFVLSPDAWPRAVAQDGPARNARRADATRADPNSADRNGADPNGADEERLAQRGAADRVAEEFTPEERINISVYERVNQSVVNITTRTTRQEGFFMLDVPAEGSGSGIVLDKEGHILTNYHVIEDAQAAQVTLFNNESFIATAVGADPDNDIAVMKIDAPPGMLFPVILGDSSRLRVGQKIYAIGNPFGLERTMTSGIISSLNRQLPSPNNRQIKSIIQIDAALNRGNSGGPLVDVRSTLVGMNTAIASPSGAGENTGVGFAIPVATIKRVVPQLLKHGRVIRPDLGITRVYQTEDGLLIASLSRGGPAEMAGLKPIRRVRERRGPVILESWDYENADLIIKADSQDVRTVDDLLTIVEAKKPGDRVILTVIRGDRQVDVPVILGDDEP